jgi:hypothetical protein
MHQISKIYFVIKLHVSVIFCAPYQELSTVLSEIGTFHAGYWPLPSRVRLELQFQPDCARKRSHNLHETYQLPHLQLITPDDGQSRCPKRVEFREKIKFWTLDTSFWLFIGRKIKESSRCVNWTSFQVWGPNNTAFILCPLTCIIGPSYSKTDRTAVPTWLY